MPKFCRGVLFLLLLVCMIALGSVTVTAQRTFHATVDGAQEVPPNASTAIGTGTVTLNPAETQITVSLNFSGLSTGQTAAHVHGAGPRGTSAGVLSARSQIKFFRSRPETWQI